jgi:halocyanin-like protein
MSRTKTPRTTATRLGRRGFLRAAGGATASVGALGTVTGTAQGQEGEAAGWFDGVDNYEGVVDRTGANEVRVVVGSEGNSGNFAFSPPAIRIDPGTTVVWEWTGKGGGHNIVAESGAFESEIASGQGHTFEHAFESEGVYKYTCVPHESMGMRGAVLVGAEASLGGASEGTTDKKPAPYGGWLEDVENFEKVVDLTGRERVEVRVGAPGNGGNFAFDPPAIHIDPGTTVIWRWSENSGGLTVVAQDESFWTDVGQEPGETFEWTFSGNRVVKYSCPAYKPLGMKGLIVVGNPDLPTIGEVLSTRWGGALGASALITILSPLAFAALLAVRGTDDIAETSRGGDARDHEE